LFDKVSSALRSKPDSGKGYAQVEAQYHAQNVAQSIKGSTTYNPALQKALLAVYQIGQRPGQRVPIDKAIQEVVDDPKHKGFHADINTGAASALKKFCPDLKAPGAGAAVPMSTGGP
jgi:hypothetical protein